MSCGCCSRSARIRTDAASTTTRRCTWRWPSGICSRFTSCSRRAPIQTLRTRIDDCETPLDMANAAGLTDAAAMLARRGQSAPSAAAIRAHAARGRTRTRRARTPAAQLPHSTAAVAEQGRGGSLADGMGACRRRAARGQRRDADHGGTGRPALADQRALLRRGGHARRRDTPAGNRPASGVRRSRRAWDHPRRCRADGRNHDP